MRGAIVLLACCLTFGCAPPFGLGEPTSRALERGVADSLGASSYEVTGYYTERGTRWSIDLETTRAGALHIRFNGGSTQQLEAIVIGGQAYYRGRQYLAAHLGADQASQNLAAAAGNAWWTSSATSLPRLPDLFDGQAFRAVFLGSAASRRTDHVTIDGTDAIELSGQRGDVYVSEAPPYRLVHLRMKAGVAVDGVADADFHYGNYDHEFYIAAPTDVINFSNLSTLPPIYTGVSVDTSGCGSPCAVSAQLKNLGGSTGAAAASTVTFTMTDAATGGVLGRCQATVAPDVGYNEVTSVSCTMSSITGQPNASVVTAVAQNPGRG